MATSAAVGEKDTSILGLLTENRSVHIFIFPGLGTIYLFYPLL